MSDSRKHDRVPCRLECTCESDNIAVYGRLGNLSEGGLFIRTITPLERGAVARLRFGTEEGIEARATVRWARADGQGGPPGMGLSFEGMDDAARAAIRSLIEVQA